MITYSFGIVAPASTTVALSALSTYTTKTSQPYWVQAVSFQALGTNSGTIFICNTANPIFSTGLGVLWEIPAPSAATSRPAWVVGDPSRPINAVDVSQFFIVPSNSGEGCRVSAVRSGTQQAQMVG